MKPNSRTRPNILVLFTDQQRFDTIAALGNPVIRTPNLDRLVREGTSFTSAYSPSPVCVPARCCLHYGQYPQTTGCYENGMPMPSDRPSLMDALASAGYHTHSIGKCHFTPDLYARRGFQTRETQEELVGDPGRDDYLRWLRRKGFSHITDPHGVRSEMYYVPQPAQMPAKLHPTQWIGDRSVAFVKSRARSREPWMLFSSFVHPHPPFAPPAPWHKLYRAPAMPLPHIPEDPEALWAWVNRRQNRYKYRDRGFDLNLARCQKAYYYACISFIDFQVGRIFAALERSGQMDNTLIVFASDHGELLGDFQCFGKRSFHDACARIPLLVRYPLRFKAGRRCDAPASLVDVAPTVLAAAGLPAGALATDGLDLATLARGTADRDAVFAQFGNGAYAIYTAVTRQWKYAYSAPDQRDFLFRRSGAAPETADLARTRSAAPARRSMERRLLHFLRSKHEVAALDGSAWRTYPRRDIPADPDAGLIVQDHPWASHRIPGYTEDAR